MQLVSYGIVELADKIVSADLSLQRTMKTMNKAGIRLVPIVHEGRLVAVAADGDLRRYLAAGGSLEDPIIRAANPNPIVIQEKMSAAAIRSFMMRRGIEALPELDGGKIVALHVLAIAPSPAEMTVVLMAGGLGSRLGPLTKSCPKPLLRMGNKPILTHIIEHLRDQGVRRFIVSVNYLAEMLIAHYGDGSEHDVYIDYVRETTRMGTGGALSLIEPQSLSDNFMICNGDLLSDINVAELLNAHLAGNWHATMVIREHSHTIPFGVVRTTDSGVIQGVEEKPTIKYSINAGIYMLSKRVLPLIPRGIFYDLPTLFKDLPRHALRAGTYKHEGRWIDVGNLADFERARSIYEGAENDSRA